MAKNSAVVAVLAVPPTFLHSSTPTLIKTKGELSNSIMKAVTPSL